MTNSGASGILGQMGVVFGLRRGNVVHFKDGTSTIVAKEIGVDNLTWNGKSLVVAAHPSLFAFIRHAVDGGRHGAGIRTSGGRLPVAVNRSTASLQR